jgi:hypothetical protein
MKIPTILIALTFLIFTDSFSQKVTYKNLRGTWERISQKAEPPVSLQFKDSINFETLLVGQEALGIYRLDNSTNQTSIFTEVTDQTGKIIKGKGFIKMVGKDTLKIQGLDYTHEIEWNDIETDKNTGIFVRRK